jgi:hypothetical protein
MNMFIKKSMGSSNLPVKIRSHVCTQRRAFDVRQISTAILLFIIARPVRRADFKPRTKIYHIY